MCWGTTTLQYAYDKSARESIAYQELWKVNSKMRRTKRMCGVSEVFLIFHPFHLSAQEVFYRIVQSGLKARYKCAILWYASSNA